MLEAGRKQRLACAFFSTDYACRGLVRVLDVDTLGAEYERIPQGHVVRRIKSLP